MLANLLKNKKLMLIFSLLIIASLMLFPACTDEATPTAEPTKAVTQATATPTTPPTPTVPPATPTPAVKAGGTFITASSTDNVNNTFDVHAGGITGWMTNFDQCYESLFSRDPKTFAIIPKIGEKYELAPDATSITIYLRKGVKWHNLPPVNGREFTSDDVRWNIERAKNANPPFSSSNNWKIVDKIETPDKYTVKLTFTQPYASILWLISDVNFPMYPRELQETYGDKQVTIAIGTGPFMFSKYEPKVSLDFVKNPDYYIKGYPLFDAYRIVYIPDPAARQSAFRAGQIHHMTNIDVNTKNTLQQSIPNMQAVQHLGYAYVLWMNNLAKPFDDVRVRQAVHLGIDRQELINLITYGSGSLTSNYNGGTPELLPTAAQFATMPGYRQPKTQDIEQAKKLLAEAGYASGVKVESLTVSTVSDYMRTNEVLKSQMAKIGIDWEIKPVDFAAASGAMFARPPTYQVMMSTVSTRPDFDKTNYWSTKSPANLWGWGSPETDALLQKGLSEPDPAKRVAIYKEFDMKLLELANTPPLFQTNTYAIAVPQLRNWQTTSGAPSQWHFEQIKYAWLDK